jgi:hypothetical protein
VIEQAAGEVAGRMLPGGHGVNQNDSLIADQSFHQPQATNRQAVHLSGDIQTIHLALHLLGDAPANAIITEHRITQADNQLRSGFRVCR